MIVAQETLFGAPQVVEERHPDWDNDPWNLYCRAEHGMPPGWLWYGASAAPEDAPPGFTRLEGAVTPIKHGKPLWAKRDRTTERVVFVDRAAFTRWNEDRCRAENTCPRCHGNGLIVESWSRDKGTTYRTCPRCLGDKLYRPGAA